MRTLYKLTNQDGTTHNGYEFGVIGKVHTKPVKFNPNLCSSDVFHAYENLNLAFLMNPHHANIKNPRVFKILGDVVATDKLKVGSFTQEVVEEQNVPGWVGSDKERQVRVLFAVKCAESVLGLFEEMYPNDTRPRKAIEVAKGWTKNPTKNAAYAAAYADGAADADAYAAGAAAYDAGAAAYDAAAYAAGAYAAGAAGADAYDAIAYAAYAAGAAYAAAYAADAYDAVAYAATYAADFSTLADEAVKEIMGNHND
jgi:hypothetical protein